MKGLGAVLGRVLLGAAAMALLVCAYAPLEIRPLVLLAPALFLILLRRHVEKGFRSIWLGGMAAWGYGLLAWIGSLAGAEAAGLVGAILVSGIFVLMSLPFLWIMRRCLRTGLPLVVAAPLVMTPFAAFRKVSSLGLSWHDLAYTLADWNILIQVVDIARVYPLDALLWALNGYLADMLIARKTRVRPVRAMRRQAPIALAAAVLFVVGYGAFRRASLEDELRELPGFAGLQTSISQREKMIEGVSRAEQRHRTALELMRAAHAEAPDTAIYVWPETSFFEADDSDPRKPRSEPLGYPLESVLHARRHASGKSVAQEFAEILGDRFPDSLHVIGLMHTDDLPAGEYDERGEGLRERNEVVLLRGLITSTGPRLEQLDEAAKMKLVPFGEYIPFGGLEWKRKELRDFVESTAGYLPALTPGERVASWTIPFPNEPVRATANVCYEVVFPEVFADGRRDRAVIAINVSNDSWYDDSAERDLVDAQMRFRAIENRMAIFRVSNTGISVSVDPLGRKRASLGRDRRGLITDRPLVGGGEPPSLRLTAWIERLLLLIALLTGIFIPAFKPKKAPGLGQIRSP